MHAADAGRTTKGSETPPTITIRISWPIPPHPSARNLQKPNKLRARNDRVQLTTDGHRAYITAVEVAFGTDVDYPMLIKMYGAVRDKEATYSPAKVVKLRINVHYRKPRPRPYFN